LFLLVKVNSKLSLHSSIDRCSCARMSIWSWSASFGSHSFHLERRKSSNLSNKRPSILHKSDWILSMQFASFLYICLCKFHEILSKAISLHSPRYENWPNPIPLAIIFAGKSRHCLWPFFFLLKLWIYFCSIHKSSLKFNSKKKK
jgi:hypothetical protein